MHKVKKYIFILVTVFIMMGLLFVLIDGTFTQKRYMEVWKSDASNKYENIQKKILSRSLRASSSHNMQPWKVEIVNDTTIKLYADLSKALDVIDPNRKQMFISQGTFIEKYKIVAKQYGYKTTEVYNERFSGGMPADELAYIATLTIEKVSDDLTADTDIITSASRGIDEIQGHSKQRQVLETALASLKKSFDTLSVELIYTEQDAKIQTYLKEAYRVESTNEPAMRELIKNFRFTEYEKNAYRYGLSLNETPVYLRPIIQPVMKWSSGNWMQFGKSGIGGFNSRLNSEFAYVLVSANDPTWETYVEAGAFYEKLATKATEYTLRPDVQILEDFDEMEELGVDFQKAYGNGEEVLLIIGVKPSWGGGTPTIRHTVEDILLQNP